MIVTARGYLDQITCLRRSKGQPRVSPVQSTNTNCSSSSGSTVQPRTLLASVQRNRRVRRPSAAATDPAQPAGRTR